MNKVKYLLFGLLFVFSFLFINLNTTFAAIACTTNNWNPTAANVTWKTSSQTQLFTLTHTYVDNNTSYTEYDSCTAAGTHGATCTSDGVTGSALGPQDEFGIRSCSAYGLDVITSPPNKVDTLLPVCGTWSGTGPTYTLSGSTDPVASGTSGQSGINTAGGSCTAPSGGGTCTVTISDVAGNTKPCTSPTYTPPALSVTTSAGANVTISPTSRSVTSGSTTTFTITPTSGYSFSVGGTCPQGTPLTGNSSTTYTTGVITGDCSVSVTATQASYDLSVSKTGNAAASGTVTSSPAGISCGSDCSQSYLSGTSVTLTPSSPGFAGWSGACTGTGSCTVTMNAAKAVTASFQNYTVSGVVSGSNGTISPSSRSVAHGATTTFTITPNSGYVAQGSDNCFIYFGEGGSLSGTTYTTGSITSNCTVTASFSLVAPSSMTVSPGSCGTDFLNISWTAVAGATSYNLYETGSRHAVGSNTLIYSGSNRSFQHTGLVAGSTHYYEVTAAGSSNYAGGSGTVASACTVSKPTVTTTTPVTNITTTTGTGGGSIVSNGGDTITTSGIVWGTSLNPTIALSTKTTDGARTGSWTSSMTGLTPNTLYHVRAYATNSAGTSYGSDVTFTTANNPATPLDIVVNPNTYSATLPNSTISAIYTLTNGTSANTTCRLLDNVGAPLTTYAACNSPMSVTAPGVAGDYLYYIQAFKASTSETKTSNSFIVTVNPAGSCANGANNPPTCNVCTAPQVWDTSTTACVAPLSVSTPTDSTVTLPTTAFTAAYTLTNGTGTNTDCYLIANDGVTVLKTDLTCTSPMSYDTPPIAGIYGYFIKAVKAQTGETRMSNMFTVTVNGGAPVPVVTLSVSTTPPSGTSGTAGVINPTLIWSATNNPTACTTGAGDDWTTGGAKPVSGSEAQGVLNIVKVYTYKLTCSNTTGPSAEASVSVDVTGGTMGVTGMLSSDKVFCDIPVGQSSCNVLLSWSTSPANAVPVSGVRSNTNNSGAASFDFHVSTPDENSNAGLSVSIPYNSRTFFLYNNAQELDALNIASRCDPAFNLNWDGGKCVDSAVDGSWTEWGPCSAANSCGAVGEKTRTCTPASNGGVDPDPVCPPSFTETQSCSSIKDANIYLNDNPNLKKITIAKGQSVKINWKTECFTSCTGTGAGFTPSGTSGSPTLKPDVTTDYVLKCGGATDFVTVMVKEKAGFKEN
ncbi:MAG: hypothetical protein WCT44_01045 [Candidatus Paceibacterota bacterium]